jgi:CheY-like chemotaxis protein
MTPKQHQQVEILLVEDNPTDVLITREAFADFKLRNTLHIVEDGIEAMNFLRHEGIYQSVPRPDLVLLDLNLPRKNGREVLAEIKSDPGLNSIPVIVLTTSQADDDIIHAYGQHANCYIVKPVGFENFVKAVQQINNFWFSLVTLPSGSDRHGQDNDSNSAD